MEAASVQRNPFPGSGRKGILLKLIENYTFIISKIDDICKLHYIAFSSKIYIIYYHDKQATEAVRS